MKYMLRALGLEPREYRVRRTKLRKRLQWIFFIDQVEGTLDSVIRRRQK